MNVNDQFTRQAQDMFNAAKDAASPRTFSIWPKKASPRPVKPTRR